MSGRTNDVREAGSSRALFRSKGGLVVRANRASALFARAALELGSQIPKNQAPVLFTYWDTFYGEPPSEKSKPNRAVYRLLPGNISRHLSDKAWLAANVASLGIDGLFPPSFFSVSEALAYRGDVSLWFLKSAHGTAGRGMRCVTRGELCRAALPPRTIIQAGVEKLRLLAGRKFTTRFYVMVWNREVFVYDEAFVVVHGPLYVPGSTDYSVQIEHTGYAQPHSPVELRVLSDCVPRAVFEQTIPGACEQLLPVLETVRKATELCRFVFLGVDALLLSDGGIRLLEINTSPNFVHTREVNTRVNVPFFVAAIRQMLGAHSPHLRRVCASGGSCRLLPT